MARAVATQHLDILAERLLIRGLLRLDTGMSIGSGQESMLPTAPDNPVMRNARQEPFVPGSSLKGAVRSYLERLAKAGWLGEGLSHEDCVGAQSSIRSLKEDHADPRELADAIWERLCPVCRLFGSLHYAGRIAFLDAPLDPDSVYWWEPAPDRPVPLEMRSGVSIDRDTGTAVDRLRYDREVVPPGTAFQVRIVVENPTAQNLMAIRLALAALQRGEIPLGGATTRGLGRVHLEQGAIRWVSSENPDQLLDYLLSPEDPFLVETGWQALQGGFEADGKLLAGERSSGPRIPRSRLLATLEGLEGDEVDLAALWRRLNREGQ